MENITHPPTQITPFIEKSENNKTKNAQIELGPVVSSKFSNSSLSPQLKFVKIK